MPLSTHKRIALEELLLRREALYARVHAIESEVNRIFGDQYPLPPPPVEVATAVTKRKPLKAASQSSPFRLRELSTDESAYRVRYQPGAGATHELHTDRKAVEALLQSPMASALVQSIETVGAEGHVRAIIYPA